MEDEFQNKQTPPALPVGLQQKKLIKVPTVEIALDLVYGHLSFKQVKKVQLIPSTQKTKITIKIRSPKTPTIPYHALH